MKNLFKASALAFVVSLTVVACHDPKSTSTTESTTTKVDSTVKKDTSAMGVDTVKKDSVTKTTTSTKKM